MSFVLDTTGFAHHNPASLLLRPRCKIDFTARPLGEATCSICRDGLCSALIRSVRHEDTGCGHILLVPMRGWSSVQVAEARCKRCRRRSDHGLECVRGRWQPGRRCGPDHDRFFCWRRAIIRKGRRRIVSGFFIFLGLLKVAAGPSRNLVRVGIPTSPPRFFHNCSF